LVHRCGQPEEKSKLILRTKSAALAIAFLLLLVVSQTLACQWAVGYFYDVTALKGKVVGTRVALFQHARWLRQDFARKHAALTLYEYCWPCGLKDMVSVKTVETDSDGKFDFGTLKFGHYTLVVEDKKWGGSERFDVEVKTQPRMTETVTIDMSPVFPDCTGGHEFVVKTK
jgi:hypothetical protein